MARTTILALLLVCFVAAVCADVTVYADGLSPPWTDYGWGTHNTADSSKGNTKTPSYSFVPGNWNAAYFYGGSKSISASTYSQITFYVFRPSGSATTLNFNWVVLLANGTSQTVGDDKVLTTYIANGDWTVDKWVKVTVGLSTLTTGTADGFWIQWKSSASASYTYYIDDVVLVSKASSAATSTTATSVKASTTTATSVKASTTTATSIKASTTTTATSVKASTTTTATSVKASTTTTTAKATTGSGSASTTGSVSTSGSSSGGTVTGPIDSTITSFFSTKSAGDGTYYGAYSSGGNCGLDPTPPNGLSSAGIYTTVAAGDYLDSKTCGMCIEVYGNGTGSGNTPITGTKLVYVNNKCPECGHGLDFGMSGDGRWQITWKAVPCPVAGNIQYVLKNGVSVWHIEIQVRNYKVPVYTFEGLVNNVWTQFARQPYNYFLYGSQIVLPLKIRVTSVFGEVINDSLTTLSPADEKSVVLTSVGQFTKSS